MKLKRQLQRFVEAVVPSVDLRVVFRPVRKLSCLSKLKSVLPVMSRSNVIYKVHCNNCDKFYVGKTKRILKQRLHEHQTDEHSALLRHSMDSKHSIAYDEPVVIASDVDELRLNVKNRLKLKNFQPIYH